MSVTILFLVIFEAESQLPEFQEIERFLVYQCLLLVADLLFFLFRSTKQSAPQADAYETVSQRWGRMTKYELLNSFVSILLYLAQISWLVYGNYIYFNLPVNIPALYDEVD